MEEGKVLKWDPRSRKGERMSLAAMLERFLDERPAGTQAYNLGAGQRKQDGFLSVDAAKTATTDIVADLFGTNWPIEDDSAGVVWMSHFMEHVPNWGQFWSEMWRVSADNCQVVILGPWFMSNRYWQDPSHCQPLLDDKFFYLNREWREANLLEHSPQYPDVHYVMNYNTIDQFHPRLTRAGVSLEAQQEAKLVERNSLTDCVWFLKALKTPESIKAYATHVAQVAQS